MSTVATPLDTASRRRFQPRADRPRRGRPAAGGHPVRARAAAGDNAPITVVAPGAAILRRFYGRFAAYLAEQGRPSLTFDYRDIGGSRSGSLKGSQVRMRDWCLLDVPGVLAWASRTYPSARSTGSATAWAALPPASPTTTT